MTRPPVRICRRREERGYDAVSGMVRRWTRPLCRRASWLGRRGRPVAPPQSCRLGWLGPEPPGTGSAPKNLLSPNLCTSHVPTPPPLPPACACVYSSPSRRTPADAAARTPRTGYCGRRRRSDRPFRTGLQRWLEKEEIPSQAPVFHEFLESIFSTFKVLIWTESSILAQDERWRRA